MEAIPALVRRSGLGALSFRAVAAETGQPVANLQYRFGSKAGMLGVAIEAIAEEQRAALRALVEAVSGTRLGPADLRRMLLWTLYASGRSAANARILLDLLFEWRGPDDLPEAARSWARELESFWKIVASCAGRDEAYGRFLCDLHLGLVLHFAGKTSGFEEAMVAGEVVDAALATRPGRSRPFFARSLARSLETIPADIDVRKAPGAPVRTLLARAVALLQDDGPEGLTYRALAKRAGQSPSAVAHHFATREVLVYSAYRFMHRTLMAHVENVVAGDTRVDADVALAIAEYPGDGRRSLLGCYSAFELYAEHHPEFEGLARFLRMTRGVYHLRKHDPDFDPFSDEAFGSFAHSFALVGTVLRRMAGGAGSRSDLDAVAVALEQFAITAQSSGGSGGMKE